MSDLLEVVREISIANLGRIGPVLRVKRQKFELVGPVEPVSWSARSARSADLVLDVSHARRVHSLDLGELQRPGIEARE
jgi:hypothetical protein